MNLSQLEQSTLHGRPDSPRVLRVRHLTSLDELRSAAAPWDDLWTRSDATIPTARAELVAGWVERFAPRSRFHAVVVEDGEKWVAAVPLVGANVLRVVPVGKIPTNSWLSHGKLLMDTALADDELPRVADRLASGLGETPWDVLWLDETPLDSRPWTALRAALSRAGIPASVLERHRTARFEINHDWNGFTAGWATAFRQRVGRLMRRLADEGEISFQARCDLQPNEVDAWLRRGFEVEHRNWKGRAGTSVLGAGMLSFFVRQARQLAAWGQLNVTFLECAGQPVAFLMGPVAKGTIHIAKIGYDEQFAKYDPGHLIQYRLYQQLWNDRAFRAVDWLAELRDYQLRYRPGTYRVGRVCVGRGLLGRMAVAGHEYALPRVRRIRQRWSDGRAAARRDNTASQYQQ